MKLKTGSFQSNSCQQFRRSSGRAQLQVGASHYRHLLLHLHLPHLLLLLPHLIKVFPACQTYQPLGKCWEAAAVPPQCATAPPPPSSSPPTTRPTPPSPPSPSATPTTPSPSRQSTGKPPRRTSSCRRNCQIRSRPVQLVNIKAADVDPKSLSMDSTTVISSSSHHPNVKTLQKDNILSVLEQSNVLFVWLSKTASGMHIAPRISQTGSKNASVKTGLNAQKHLYTGLNASVYTGLNAQKL